MTQFKTSVFSRSYAHIEMTDTSRELTVTFHLTESEAKELMEIATDIYRRLNYEKS